MDLEVSKDSFENREIIFFSPEESLLIEIASPFFLRNTSMLTLLSL